MLYTLHPLGPRFGEGCWIVTPVYDGDAGGGNPAPWKEWDTHYAVSTV